MTFGSLFAGIGGLDLGLDRAGMECRWQVEIDPFCASVLERHWPGVKRYGDIKNLDGSELERVDLICGGFPCQPVSVAGRRKAQADERWLWPEFCRIIRVVRPRFILVENTPGLLSAPEDDPGAAMGEVLGDLAASGYDAEWDCIPACALGAPQLRYRVFLFAYPQCEGRGAKGSCGPEGEKEAGTPAKPLRSDSARVFADPDFARLAERQEQVMLEQLASAERIAPNAYGARFAPAGRRGRKKAQGEVGQQEVEHGTSTSPDYDGEPLVGAAIARGERHAWTAEPRVVRMVHGVPGGLDRRAWVRYRRNAIKALGNAVVPQVAEWVGRRIIECAG